MKKQLIYLFSAFGLSILMACDGQAKQNDNAGENEKAASSMEEKMPDKAQEEKLKQQSNSNEQLVYAYLDLKSALVSSDAQQSAKAAEALAMVIDAEKEELKEVNTLAATIAESEDIELQRKTFYALSEDLYAYLKENPVEGLTLYRQFCPMAFNNEGAFWLSDSEEIRNPYFGDKMLKCGKVEEKL